MLLEKIKSHAILLLLFLLIIIVLFVNRPFHTAKETINVFESSSDNRVAADNIEEIEAKEQTIVVDVKGAVKTPGVYEISKDSRVNDVIKLAGGLREDADENGVNLAEIVYDEMLIYVPTADEVETGETLIEEQAEKIRVNQATSEELQRLSGIGPAKAEAIIQYRKENGPFHTTEDLLSVPGIGEKTLENIVDFIIIP